MELKDFTEKEQEMIKKRLTISNISDKETAEKILALVPQDLIKRIPFFVRKHATTRTIKRISKEKSEAKHWSENMEKAVRQSYHWNVEYNRYELAINYENIEAILRLRRKIQDFKREVGDTLFISPRYPNEATWREEALKEF